MSKSAGPTSPGRKRWLIVQGAAATALLALAVGACVARAPRPSPQAPPSSPSPQPAGDQEAALRAAIKQAPRDRMARLHYLEFLLDGKRTLDALDVCRDAVRVLPLDPAIRAALADSLEATGRLPEAIRVLSSASPAETGLRLQLARLLTRSGQPREAVKIIKTVGNPSSDQALTAALILVDARQPQGAVRLLRPFVKAGHTGELLNTYGFVLLQSANYREAAATLHEAMAHSREIPVLHYYAGCALRLAGQPKQLPHAVTELQVATSQVTGEALFFYELARCLMSQEDWAGAETALEQAAALGATQPEIQRDLSVVSAKNGHALAAALARARYLQAVDDGPGSVRALQPLVASHPDDLQLALALPVALHAAGQFPRASAVLAGYRKRKPQDTDLMWSQYHLYIEIKQYAPALAVLKELEAQSGPNPTLLKERAATLQRLNRYAEAEEILVQLRDREPDEPIHHYNLGIALNLWSTRADAKQQAEVELRKAVELRPENSEALYALGQLLLTQGKPDAAVPYFRRALDFTPTHPDALRLLGRAYLQLGEKERSADVFQLLRVLQARDKERNRLELPVQQFRDMERSRMALARFHLRGGNLTAATRELEMVAYHFPQNVEAHQLLAPLYGHARRFQRQSEELEWLKARGQANGAGS